MDRIILVALALVGTAGPAFASITVPEPATMSVFGLGVGALLAVLAYPAMVQERLIEGLESVRACAGGGERACNHQP